MDTDDDGAECAAGDMPTAASASTDQVDYPGGKGQTETPPLTAPPGKLMDHFDGAAFEAVDEEKHNGMQVRLSPMACVKCKEHHFQFDYVVLRR